MTLPIDELVGRVDSAAALLAQGLFGRLDERDAMEGALKLLERALLFARMVPRP